VYRFLGTLLSNFQVILRYKMTAEIFLFSY
jgi:hypothetical protein